MDKLYRVVIIDDDEFSADNLCLKLKKYNRLSIDGMARNGANGRKLLEKDGIFSRMWQDYQTSVQWKVSKEVQ